MDIAITEADTDKEDTENSFSLSLSLDDSVHIHSIVVK